MIAFLQIVGLVALILAYEFGFIFVGMIITDGNKPVVILAFGMSSVLILFVLMVLLGGEENE